MIRVPLTQIDDNPYQTRLNYGALDDLTDSLVELHDSLPETSGMIQVPLARLVYGGVPIDPADYGGVEEALTYAGDMRVQLALGHRRKRAFITLSYDTFPVEIRVLDDEAMADIAWSENEKRKDVSDIERALAIERAIADFGWTQAEVGDRWDLSQSAVSNLLRLLRLPEKVRGLIRDGEITGRHGRALLPLVDLDARWEVYLDAVRPDDNGRPTVAEVEGFVAGYLQRETYPLEDAPWDDDWEPGIESTRACDDCPNRMRVGREQRCTSVACFHAKQRAYKHRVRGPAMAARTYNERLHTTGWLGTTEPSGWARCSGCGRSPRDFDQGGEWLKANYNFICPTCAEIAQLKPAEAQRETTSQVVAAATVTPPATSEAPEEEVYPTWQPTNEELASGGGTIPATTPPQSQTPAPAAKPTIPAPTPKPAPPPATILTARITPGEDLAERRVMVSIGPEGRGPVTFRNGTLLNLGNLVAEVVNEVFGELYAETTGEVLPAGSYVRTQLGEYGTIQSYTSDMRAALIETADGTLTVPAATLQEVEREPATV